MLYKEYMLAANRHLNTCKLLLDKAESLSPQGSRDILENVYYLSGYVIETSLSYSFFSHIRWNKAKDIEDCEWYNTDFKTHNLHAKLYFLQSHGINFSGCVILDKNPANHVHKKMAYRWSVDLRYQLHHKVQTEFRFDLNILREYISVVEEVKNHIYSLYPL